MKRLNEINAAATLLCLGLAACSGGDGDAPPAARALAGGSLARAAADSTAQCTVANSGVTPGFPASADPEDGADLFVPAPAAVGTDIPVTYFGPAPSSVNRNLIGPYQLLKAGRLDTSGSVATLTLPLYEGRLERPGSSADGSRIWYIVTDTSDQQNAAALGLNFSAKLNFSDAPPEMAEAMMEGAVRQAHFDNAGILVFDRGAVDFAPERAVQQASTDVSGTHNLLEGLQYQPGSVGSSADSENGFYSPLVQISNAGGHIYNAPMVAFGTDATALRSYCEGIPSGGDAAAHALLHDKVLGICPGEDGEPGTVTLALTNGFSFGRPVLYLSTDASADIAASLEAATFAPALGAVAVGRDDSLFSAVERIFGFTNGPTNDYGEVNPQRQGFNSAILGQGAGPLNVLGGIPTVATDYSPLWDLNLGEWTQEAVDNGYRSRMTEEFAILGMAQRGFLTGPGGTPYGSTGIIINCPIVHRLL